MGLCLPAGVDMLVAVLAVWKAGAAYLPLDQAAPAERLAFTLTDSQAVLLAGTVASLAATTAVLGELPASRIPTVTLDDTGTGGPGVVPPRRG